MGCVSILKGAQSLVLFLAAAGAAAVLFVVPPALAADMEPEAKALVKLDDEWSNAAATKDADRVGSLYAEDAIAYPPNQPVVVGPLCRIPSRGLSEQAEVRRAVGRRNRRLHDRHREVRIGVEPRERGVEAEDVLDLADEVPRPDLETGCCEDAYRDRHGPWRRRNRRQPADEQGKVSNRLIRTERERRAARAIGGGFRNARRDGRVALG
jgi:hypothetical protein